MARGIVDIIVSETAREDGAALVTDCYNGVAEELRTLTEGDITFKKGGKEKILKCAREQGDECGYPCLEISPATAEALELKDGARYLLDYDEGRATMTMTRVSVSRAQAIVTVDASPAGRGRLGIGYALLSRLGMGRRKATTVRYESDNDERVGLRLQVPSNELDSRFRLPAALAGSLGLQSGMPVTLEYNQATQTLQCLERGLTLRFAAPKPPRRKPAGLTQRPATSAAASRPAAERAPAPLRAAAPGDSGGRSGEASPALPSGGSGAAAAKAGPARKAAGLFQAPPAERRLARRRRSAGRGAVLLSGSVTPGR